MFGAPGWKAGCWFLSPTGLRTAKAIAESPEKSDRAIAAELGVGNKTVSRARAKATVSPDTVGRVGLDGKERRGGEWCVEANV